MSTSLQDVFWYPWQTGEFDRNIFMPARQIQLQEKILFAHENSVFSKKAIEAHF